VAKSYRLGFVRKTVNALGKVAIRLGLAPRGSHLLTTTGRKTGQRHTTPVYLVEREGQRYLVAPYGPRPWVLNARAAGEVTLSRGRHTHDYVITEVALGEAAPVLKEYVGQVPVVRSFFDATKASPVSAFEAEADRHPVFRLS
jgi:deazaflavin-dependent oxidoreductase (nitroreductase family)